MVATDEWHRNPGGGRDQTSCARAPSAPAGARYYPETTKLFKMYFVAASLLRRQWNARKLLPNHIERSLCRYSKTCLKPNRYKKR